MKATDILHSEHEVILDVLNALESISRDAAQSGTLDVLSAGEALEFLRNFADRCHHGKEEQHFFPSLMTHGLPRQVGPLAVMLADHDSGRALIARMTAALAAAKGFKPNATTEFRLAANEYVTLMRDHIDKENGVLFPMGDEMLSDADQTMLSREFERVEHEDMEPGAHERFQDLARTLCARLGVTAAPRSATSGRSCCGHTAPRV